MCIFYPSRKVVLEPLGDYQVKFDNMSIEDLQYEEKSFGLYAVVQPA